MAKHHDDLDPEIEQVVDDLLKADKIIERFRERCKSLDIECEFDPPGLMDRLMLVHTGLLYKGTGMASQGIPPEVMMKKLDALRIGLGEEMKAYVESLMAGKQGINVWTDDESRKVDRAFTDVGLPPLSQMIAMKSDEIVKAMTPQYVQGVPEPVANKDEVHAKFQDVLFKKNIDERYARRTLELLVATPEGNDLLKVMVFDAMAIKQTRAKADKKS